MPSRSETLKRLGALLDAQLHETERLQRVLDEEREALSRTDPAPLEAIARRKIDLALAFERLETDRRRLLRDAAGIDADDPALFTRWLQRVDKEGLVTQRWRALRERLQACRERNRGIGHTLELQRRRTENALRVLRGQPLSSQTYDPSGTASAETGLGKRNLGLA